MDAIIAVIGVLGLGALVISVYVFAMAARRFVADDSRESYVQIPASNDDSWVPRSGRDRRQNDAPVIFPITVDGRLISEERRQGDRRSRRAG